MKKVEPSLNKTTKDEFRRYDWSVGMYEEYLQTPSELA